MSMDDCIVIIWIRHCFPLLVLCPIFGLGTHSWVLVRKYNHIFLLLCKTTLKHLTSANDQHIKRHEALQGMTGQPYTWSPCRAFDGDIVQSESPELNTDIYWCELADTAPSNGFRCCRSLKWWWISQWRAYTAPQSKLSNLYAMLVNTLSICCHTKVESPNVKLKEAHWIYQSCSEWHYYETGNKIIGKNKCISAWKTDRNIQFNPQYVLHISRR